MHDELVVEVSERFAEQARAAVEALMLYGFGRVCDALPPGRPGPVKVEAVISKTWAGPEGPGQTGDGLHELDDEEDENRVDEDDGTRSF